MLSMILLFIGTTEIIVIGAVVLLVFGGKKLPELMRGLGKGMKEFKEGMSGAKEEPKEESKEEPTSDTPADKKPANEDNPPVQEEKKE